MFARLESAVKTLSQFVADASHELRTPLAVIRTTAELALRRARTPESYRDSLQEVAAEAERMTRLVEELLVLARSDAATAEMPLGAVDVREVLTEICDEMRSLAEMRQIRINTLYGDGAAIVAGNRPALHRLFLVLLDNALKFSHPGGEVILRVENSRVAGRGQRRGFRRRHQRKRSAAHLRTLLPRRPGANRRRAWPRFVSGEKHCARSRRFD